MRVTTNQYAKTLYETTKDKSRKEIDDVILNLMKILQKNNQANLFAEISQKFNEIWNKEKGIVEAEVITSRKLKDSQAQQVESFIKKKYQTKGVILQNIIDTKIKGGMIIKVGEEILDASVRRKINLLKNMLTK